MYQTTHAMNGQSKMPDPEVSAKAKRRTFTAEYKQRILEEADASTEPSELGALLRREGLYSSNLATWRRQREAEGLAGLTPKKRGRKKDEEAAELAKLQRENERLRKRLERTELIIAAQKKVGASLGDADPGRRRAVVKEVVAELAKTVPVSQACDAVTYPRSTFYWDRRTVVVPATVRAPSTRGLRADEKERVRDLLNSERFQDASPRQVYAVLLDEGVYHCHWRTMYRILAENNEVRERRNQLRHPAYQKPELLATGPNQVRAHRAPLGHHSTQRAGQVEFLLSLCDSGHLQPLHRRLARRSTRIGGAGPAACQ